MDFDHVNTAGLAVALAVVSALLPDGHQAGAEWVAKNPTRPDRKPGSFKVNLTTGKWGDFATGYRGGDLVSLAAYVTRQSQREAAIRLAESLAIDPFEGTGR